MRRTVAIPPPGKDDPALPGSDCCYVSFPTAGHLQPDGRDLRVAVAGKPVPFKVVDIAYGGAVRLVVSIPKRAEQMHIYYGNSKAPALTETLHPRRGLWLETRRYLGGDCLTLTGIRAAWAKAAAKRDGAGPAGSVFHGHNPFGHSDNYMSRYTGYLYLPKAATVNFAVGADDIGYVLVEGREVAAKKDWGEMNRHRRYAGEAVQLAAGLHPVEVLHVEKTGQQNIAAAWWMPGMKRGQKYKAYQLIPAKSFAPLRYGRLLNHEVQGDTIGVDFSSANDGDVLLDERQLIVRYVFRDMSRPASNALQCSVLWDFGDGTTSTARDPSHVYLHEGDYTVTLALSRGQRSWKATQAIRVGPGYHRAGRRQWDSLANYHPILKDYQFAKMATQDLITAARIFEELEKPAEIIAACTPLYERRKDLADDVLVRHCLLLACHLREDEGEKGDQGKANARKSLEALRYAEHRTQDAKAKARLANEQADIYYYFLDDYENAQKHYTQALTTYGKADATQMRLAQIRLGDVYRTKGDTTAARQAYERAAQMPIGDQSAITAAARRGSFPQTVEDYLRRKTYKEALKGLDTWEWEFPTAKLDGYSSLLRAKVAMGQENRKEALKQCRELLAGNKDSEYADDILLLLSRIHQEAGQLDKAVEAVSRLLEEYPASELQERAHVRRATLNLSRAKYAEAAGEALALADANRDSEHAPQALLLAATAQMRQKKPEDATRTLERLTQQHATSPEATQAIKMLKELRRR
ncbi:MAG: tetratricopeptide repeat protein [Candidatus Brocadiae bacterium]|nr:tetratricopeptide repeat protein [Candidatus Brocadiia bacterium]